MYNIIIWNVESNWLFIASNKLKSDGSRKNHIHISCYDAKYVHKQTIFIIRITYNNIILCAVLHISISYSL